MVRNAIDDFWDRLDDEQKQGLLEVQKKYKDNPWWKSDDPFYVIKHQIEEPLQVVSFPTYINMLGKFLDRPLSHLEFAFNYSKIIKEVKFAINRKEAGIIESEEQKEVGRKDYANRLTEIVENKLPKDIVMRVDLPEESDKNENGIDTSGYDGWLK